jgi:hypothetical protein
MTANAGAVTSARLRRGTSYFPGLAAMKLHVPLVNPGWMTHPQPRMLGQGCFLLSQKLPQVEVWTFKDSWRAETLPVARTPMSSALKSVVLTFLSMVDPFSFNYRDGGLDGLAAINPHTPESNPGWRTHPQPRTLGHGSVLLQKWCWQVVSWTFRDNWWAETVPAQRTAAAIPVKMMFLIVLPMVRPPFTEQL